MKGTSSTRIGMLVLLLLTAAGLIATLQLKDAPAWWQAILSGAALFATALFWKLDKDQARLERVREQEALTSIIIAALSKIRDAAQALHALQPPEEANFLTHWELEALVLSVKHRWDHLALFSPYDRLGSFEMVGAVADVDVACRNLAILLTPPPPVRAAFSTSSARLDEDTAQRSAAELIELSTRAIRTLRNRIS